MTLSRYEIFNTVVKTGNLTKAGAQLKLTQSGVSHAITSLEKEFGFSLLTRGKTGVHLTINGERMMPYIRDILHINNQMKQVAASIKGLDIGEVKIGTFTSVASQWLPHIIKEFEEIYPGITLHLVEGDYSTLEEWVLQGVIDCSFLTTPSSKSIEFHPLKKDRMLCILSDKHPLHNQESISFQQLQNESLIKPKAGWNNEIDQIFKENNIKPKVKFEVSDDLAILAMVQNNLGISIRPEMTLSQIPDNIRILSLEKDAYRLIGIATKPYMSPATEKFIEYVHTWLRNHQLLDTK